MAQPDDSKPGFAQSRLDDDVEGHAMLRKAVDDDDVEGHGGKTLKAVEDDDVEGHYGLLKSPTSRGE